VGSAQSYVMTDAEQEQVVGSHALTAASVRRESAIPRALKGIPKQPIPARLLRAVRPRAYPTDALNLQIIIKDVVTSLRDAEAH
jgi:hypothetical protein